MYLHETHVGAKFIKYVLLGIGRVNPLDTGKIFARNDECKNTSEKQVKSYGNIIFILAYFRSGSSFTGSIFKQYPGTFYLYEPIRKVFKMSERRFTTGANKLTYVNGFLR